MDAKLSAARILTTVSALALGAALPLTVSPANADLIGTSVSGVANSSILGLNLFDPANGGVPPGMFGNSAPHGPNNVIIGSEIEFGLVARADTITADFTGT